jgi:RNA polymerase sigma factor (TIGR02999 family)
MADAAGNDDDLEASLRAAAGGDAEAKRRLWAEHYGTLHAAAAAYLARRWRDADGAARVSLSATDVLHEAFSRLHGRIQAVANGRQFFFRAFYQECLRIVVDHYRRTRDAKGRGAAKRLPFESEYLRAAPPEVDFDAVLGTLAELQQKDARMGQIACLRVLEGKTNAECAELLGIGLRTVEQDWSFAKAWLDRRLLA